jgi:hypothetical protein
MVAASRRGVGLRRIARQQGVALSTVQFWVRRAGSLPLRSVDWGDRPAGCRRAANRTRGRTERAVLRLRRELRDRSVLGEYGAAAIRREMLARGLARAPSVRTIGRILSRSGCLDRRGRLRRPPPPRGWHLPEVAQRRAELDSFDAIEGLKIQGGPIVEVLNGISLHGRLAASWPVDLVTAKFVVSCLEEHWRTFGLPDYAQFDNGSIFAGNPRFTGLGRVIRFCLSLGVTPVFAPPREHGLQNLTESFNALYQAKVWRRHRIASLRDLSARSGAYVLAHRDRTAPARDSVERRPFPPRWRFNPQSPLCGRVVYIRRTDERGRFRLLKHTFEADPHWPHRLVRAVLDLDHHRIHVYRLRKREPHDQPLLRTIAYRFPRKPFSE